jgi:hypothetical protein
VCLAESSKDGKAEDPGERIEVMHPRNQVSQGKKGGESI